MQSREGQSYVSFVEARSSIMVLSLMMPRCFLMKRPSASSSIVTAVCTLGMLSRNLQQPNMGAGTDFMRNLTSSLQVAPIEACENAAVCARVRVKKGY